MRRALDQILGSWLPYAFLWALTRAYLGWELVHRVGYIVGDVNYYFTQLAAGDLGKVLIEYPTPVVWALDLLRTATGRDQQTFVVGFMICMVLLDAIMASLLWIHGGSRRGIAVLAWIIFIAFMGPLAYVRFDLAPALLAGAAALYVRKRPATAGSLVAVGAALKLWPALLVLPLLGRGKQRLRSGVGFAAVGVALAMSSLATAGWARTISPLTWQSDRGLQIESIPATAVMWLRTFNPSLTYQVGLSRYNAYEITGPGVAGASVFASIATGAGLLVIAWLGWRTFRLPTRGVTTVAVVMLAIILVMIVTNKTLSPQYIFWLGGPVCAFIACSDEGPGDVWGAPLLSAAALWFVALLTQQVYPTLYGELVTGAGTPLATSVLVIRNVSLVVLTAIAIWYAAVLTRRPAEGDDSPADRTKSVTMRDERPSIDA